MYLPLTVTEPGVIRFVQTEGNIVEVGALIATIELDDPSKVQRATLFTGTLPDMKPPAVKGDKPHQILRESIHSIRRTLAGYHGPSIKKDVEQLLTHITNPHLPLLEFQECLSRISARLPKTYVDILTKDLNEYKETLTNFSGMV